MATQVRIVIVPIPAQGHLNQLLHLSRLISSYAIPLHFVSTATHNRQARLRIHGWDPLSDSNLRFHDFPTSSSSDDRSPFRTLFNASSELRQPVSELLRSLSRRSRRVIVIHDALMASAVQDVASLPNAEAYNFQSVSAFAVLLFALESQSKPFLPKQLNIPAYRDCFPPEILGFVAAQSAHRDIDSGNLYNTCRAIEGSYLDLLSEELIWGSNVQFPIGPFNPVALSRDSKPRHRCLEWLDEQEPDSVIFVSFGTTTSLSGEQINELALGLEKSGHKFIWALRDADKWDVFAEEEIKGPIELPKGYEERVGERGIVVRDWALQLEILEHPSTGGFMSHCGWNSCMESISMGVPIAAWPMHSDQPMNALLVTELLRIGIMVREWAKREELLMSSEIEEAVRKLMGSEEGDEMRKRAAQLGVAVRSSAEGNGESRLELDSFIAHITR